MRTSLLSWSCAVGPLPFGPAFALHSHQTFPSPWHLDSWAALGWGWIGGLEVSSTDVHPALFGAEPRLSVKKQIRHHSVFLRVQARCPHCCDYAPGLTPNLGGLFPYPQVQKG